MTDDEELTSWEKIDKILTAKVPPMKGKLPTLSDFDESYKHTIREAHEFYKESGDLAGRKKIIKGTKK
jgi:hypothetical protein